MAWMKHFLSVWGTFQCISLNKRIPVRTVLMRAATNNNVPDVSLLLDPQRPFLPIATDRLLLRPIQISDAPVIAQLLNNWNVTKTTCYIPYPYTLNDAHQFINNKIPAMKNGREIILAIIERQPKQQLLGIISCENTALGYWLGEPYWGKGYMKEAATAFVHYLFDRCEIPELKVSVMPSNIASVKIIESFNFISTFQQTCSPASLHGETRTAQSYKLSRKEYWSSYESKTVPIVHVSAAAILQDGKLLVAERPQGKAMAGLWEFPGGKIEIGETPEQALARELHEELGITVDAHDLKPCSFCSYRYAKFHLVMPLFTLTNWEGDIHNKEGQRFAWIQYNDLVHYPTPAADVGLFHKLYDALNPIGLWS